MPALNELPPAHPELNDFFLGKTSAEARHKPWILILAMFLVGFVGGAAGIAMISYRQSDSRETPNANSQLVVGRSTTSAIAVQSDEPSSSSMMTDRTAMETRTASSDRSTEIDELRQLREEIAKLRASTQQPQAAIVQSRHSEAPQQTIAIRSSGSRGADVGQATLQYWNQMNNIMQREAAMRAAPPKITANNATAYVSGRTSAFQFAGNAIRQLNTQNVDPAASRLGDEIAAWYDAGIANSEEAESLLGSADIAARQGAAGKGWRAAEEQHRKQCLEINQRGEQIRRELSRKYGISFPALQ